MTVTGGTYNPTTGVATFTTNSGNTFNVSGFLTGFTDVKLTGASFNYGTKVLTLTNSDGSIVTAGGFQDNFVTNATYNSGTGVLSIFRNSGSTITVPGFLTGATGGSGIIIVSYIGTPRGTSGTITQTGGYTIHTFTSSGTFTA
jgi:hypothetical protein